MYKTKFWDEKFSNKHPVYISFFLVLISFDLFHLQIIYIKRIYLYLSTFRVYLTTFRVISIDQTFLLFELKKITITCFFLERDIILKNKKIFFAIFICLIINAKFLKLFNVLSILFY